MGNADRHPKRSRRHRPALWLGAAIMAAAGADHALGQLIMPFDVRDGMVIPDADCAVRVEVLGAANRSSSHGGYDRATTLRLHVTDEFGTTVDFEPFGDFDGAVDGNVNDGRSHAYTFMNMFRADSQFSITGRSWSWDGSGTSNSDWSIRQEENSNLDPDWVVVLRDGDTVPSLPGFADQASVVDFLEPYLDIPSQTLQLGPNDVVFLFELASSSTSSIYYDLQDLIVVITVQDSPSPSFD